MTPRRKLVDLDDLVAVMHTRYMATEWGCFHPNAQSDVNDCVEDAGEIWNALPVPPRSPTVDEAVEKALLFTFQLSDKDYRAMRTALSEVAFIRALEQDGYTVIELPPLPGRRG